MFYKIVCDKVVAGQFSGVNDAGELFVGFGNKVCYPKKKGLMIALSRAGHTYPESEKAVPKVNGVALPKVNLTDDQILDVYEYAKSLITEKGDGTKDFTAANAVAREAGYSFFGALSKRVQGIRFGRMSEQEKAELKAKAEARAVKAVTPEDDSVPEHVRVFRNKKAAEHGFTGYRAVRRAANRGDAKAKAVRELIQAVVRDMTKAAASARLDLASAQTEVKKAEEPVSALNSLLAKAAAHKAHKAA